MFIHQRSALITVALASALLSSVASAAGENFFVEDSAITRVGACLH